MIDILQESQLFKGLDQDDLKVLVRKYTELEIFEKGSYVFLAGDKPEYMYLLVEGEVSVFSDDQFGKRELLKTFSQPGTLFGETYLYLNIQGFDLSCLVEKNAKLLTIRKGFFEQIYDLESHIGKIVMENYLQILSEKLYFFNRKIRMMSGFTLRQKLSRYILENRIDRHRAELKHTREEIADFLGVTRPSVSRELARMKRDGLIDYSRNKIEILDLKDLENNY